MILRDTGFEKINTAEVRTSTSIVNKNRLELRLYSDEGTHTNNVTPDCSKKDAYINSIIKRKSFNGLVESITPTQLTNLKVEGKSSSKSPWELNRRKEPKSSVLTSRRPRRMRKEVRETTAGKHPEKLLSVIEEFDDPKPETGSIPFEVLNFDNSQRIFINNSLDVKSQNQDLLEELDQLKHKLRDVFRSISLQRKDKQEEKE